jgi:teichuronic acid biosynthesis glycosyltransferase TuaC
MSGSNYNVLVITNRYPGAAAPDAGRCIHDQVRGLVAGGESIVVLAPVPWSPRFLWWNPRWRRYGQAPAATTLNGVQVYYPRYLRPPGAWMRPWAGFVLYLSIRSLVHALHEKQPFDLVHGEVLIPAGHAALLVARELRLPVVCTARGSDVDVWPQEDQRTRETICKVLEGCDQIITISHGLRETALSLASPRREIRVIYNSVDQVMFQDRDGRARVRAQLSLPPSALIVLFVGRAYVNKGVFELIEAFSRVREQIPDAYLVVVGDGPHLPALNHLVAERGLTSCTRLPGQRPHEEIPQWMEACDLFVLPSHNEGLGNVVLEAMACARPVVATDVGGIPELVSNGITGMLVPKQNVNELAQAIACLLSDQRLRERMGKAGRDRVAREFSWERNAAAMQSVYEEVLTGSGKRQPAL